MNISTWHRGPGACLALVLSLAACGEDRAPDDEVNPPKGSGIVRIVPAAEALAGAYVPTLDPMTMHGAEIRKALEAEPACIFRYTSAGKPVVAMSMQSAGNAARGVVKLNGHLVVLTPLSPAPPDASKERFSLGADPVRVAILPGKSDQTLVGSGRQEANMMFEVGQELRVGYGGYLECGKGPSPK